MVTAENCRLVDSETAIMEPGQPALVTTEADLPNPDSDPHSVAVELRAVAPSGDFTVITTETLEVPAGGLTAERFDGTWDIPSGTRGETWRFQTTVTSDVALGDPVTDDPTPILDGQWTIDLQDTVTWTASAENGDLASGSWDMGDGTTYTGLQVSHSYSSTGTYTIAFTGTLADGGTISASQDVDVFDFSW